MNTKVAIATVSGKAYFLIVKKLQERKIDFISLIPGEPVPTEVKLVITTNEERDLINHEKILVYNSETEIDAMATEITKILRGKKDYERIVIGVDPGEMFGLAVVADGKVNETGNCYGIQEMVTKIRSVIKNVDLSSTVVVIKIGSGVLTYKDLIEVLDQVLPLEVVLEVVSEAGTTRTLIADKHRRGLRDIASAIRIAGRAGHIFPRRNIVEPTS
jgi:hypothetical protein